MVLIKNSCAILVFFLLAIIALLPDNAFAQKFRNRKQRYESHEERKEKDVFPKELQYYMKGWYFGPGVTYTLTRLDNPVQPFKKSFSNADGSSFDAEFDPDANIGLYLEAGRYHILEYSSLFKYLDYGLAYKSLRGKEVFSTPAGNSGQAKFGDHFIQGYFNLNNVIIVSDYTFIQNTIGVNADFAFLQNRTPLFAAGEQYPGRFVAQLHYKFGFGIKESNKLMIIPSIETPIFGLWPFNITAMGALDYHHSRFRPIIISIRFLFLRPKSEDCPPVYNPAFPEGVPQEEMQK